MPPITLLQLTCWMLCTAELVSSPTFPVNSPSFSVYSLKAGSSGTWASSSSPDFCFRFWPRLGVFMCCFPSGSSPCSRANSGWSKHFQTKHQVLLLSEFQERDNHLKLVYCQFPSEETNFSKILTPGIETSPCNYVLPAPLLYNQADQQLVAAWTCSTGADSLKKHIPHPSAHAQLWYVPKKWCPTSPSSRPGTHLNNPNWRGINGRGLWQRL